jgi:hypothetical protein
MQREVPAGEAAAAAAAAPPTAAAAMAKLEPETEGPKTWSFFQVQKTLIPKNAPVYN